MCAVRPERPPLRSAVPGGDAGCSSRDVLTQVRSATADLHRATERRVLGRRPFASVPAYGDLLSRLGAWELSVRAALPAPERGAMAHRRRLLLDDLAALDHSGPLPLVPFDPGSALAALGARYAVEGSRNGGAVLADLARRHLGRDVPVGFLGDDDREPWAAVVRRLVAVVPEEGPAVADGARRAFRLVADLHEN